MPFLKGFNAISNSGKDSLIRALVSAALNVGERRNEILKEMRRALLRDDTEQVIRCARILTGLDDTNEESNRTDSSIH